MGFYTNTKKISGDGLALTEWNDLSNAVAGNAGLTLAVNPADNVGVGATAPVSKLHLNNGSLWVGGTHANALPNSAGAGIRIFNEKNSKISQIYAYDYKNSKALHIALQLPGGNIGIGTDSPAEKLEVAGNVKATGNITASKFIGDGSGLTNLSVGATGLVLATTSGRVGVGTTAPSHKFHVKASTYVGRFESTSNQAILQLHTSEGDNKAIELCNRKGGRAAIWVKGAGDSFNVLQNGNVGIGTTSPTQKLEVKGNIKANKFIGINLKWSSVKTTGWINNFDAVMNYNLGAGNVMVGLYSEHSNSREDRKWKIKYRTLSLSGV